jgi:hypothetical protein
MSIKRMVAVTLALALTAGSAGSLGAQGSADNGVLGGKATDKAKQPYSDYSIRLRGADARTIIKTTTLDGQGQFNFAGLALPQRYLVELFDTKNNKVVCTEGPFVLNPQVTSRTDVNVDCGKNPTAWILAGGAGAALLAAATQSSSQ